MWDSPFTTSQIELLQKLGVRVIQPMEKKLACGDIGRGAMADVVTIDRVIKDTWRQKQSEGYQQSNESSLLTATPLLQQTASRGCYPPTNSTAATSTSNNGIAFAKFV